jgi:predicted ATPase
MTAMTAGSDDTFVGREREMAELTAALEDTIAGRGRLVMLVGEPGIGKTRTAEELAVIARQRGAEVLWGHCPEERGAPPYWPWVQVTNAHAEAASSDVLRTHFGKSAAALSQPTNRALIATVLFAVVAALGAVGCDGAATAASDVEDGGVQGVAAAIPAATDLSAVGSGQPAFLDASSVQIVSIDPAMLQPERQSEFPELAPLSPAEFSALLR